MSLTNAELAILSLLVERPRHGYDIEQTIVDRNMRDWTDIAFSSIYYVLDKLETAGLVTSAREPAPGRGPARRVYSLTDAGTDAMHDEALRAIAGPARRPSDFQLGLAVLPMLEPGAVAAAVTRHLGELDDQLDLLADRREAAAATAPNAELPFHVAAMFDLGITQIRAELDWLRRFAADLERQHTERTMT